MCRFKAYENTHCSLCCNEPLELISEMNQFQLFKCTKCGEVYELDSITREIHHIIKK